MSWRALSRVRDLGCSKGPWLAQSKIVDLPVHKPGTEQRDAFNGPWSSRTPQSGSVGRRDFFFQGGHDFVISSLGRGLLRTSWDVLTGLDVALPACYRMQPESPRLLPGSCFETIPVAGVENKSITMWVCPFFGVFRLVPFENHKKWVPSKHKTHPDIFRPSHPTKIVFALR